MSDSLYTEIMDYARERVLFADEIIPLYPCSIGSHIANLHQQENPFFFVKRRPEKINVPIMTVAPPGLTKTYAMKFFFDKKYGLCDFKSAFRSQITTAGFVGTFIEGDFRPGDASDYSKGFLCFNEMSSVIMTSETTHSGDLVNAIMEALSEGLVSKRLGTGVREIPTNVTIWGATQPARFDFRGGLGRRFAWVVKAWTPQDIEVLKRARQDDNTQKDSFSDIEMFRRRFRDVQEDFCIEKVEFDPAFYNALSIAADSHTVLQKYEHIFIGKEVLDNYDKKKITIKKTDANMELLGYISQNYKNINMGGDVALIISTIRELCKELQVDGVTRNQLWEAFRRFGYSYDQFYWLVENTLKIKGIDRFRATDDGPYWHNGEWLFFVGGKK